MAWTQADIDRLERAIATGAMSGRFDNRSIAFRSVDEMFKLLTVMKNTVNPQNKTRIVRFQTSKGL